MDIFVLVSIGPDNYYSNLLLSRIYLNKLRTNNEFRFLQIVHFLKYGLIMIYDYVVACQVSPTGVVDRLYVLLI